MRSGYGSGIHTPSHRRSCLGQFVTMQYSLREPEESFFLVSAPSTPTAPLEFSWPSRTTHLNTAVSSFWQLTMSRGFKALRRSIKGGEKDSKPHITIQPKSAVAIVPPKKVCLRTRCQPQGTLAKLVITGYKSSLRLRSAKCTGA